MQATEFDASSEYLNDETRIVRVRGELDLYTAPEFERALEQNRAADGRVVVDLSECTFIDSTGLGILVKADRRGDPDALLIVANGVEVLRAFKVSGLDRRLVLHPTIESALNGGAITGWRDMEARTQALFRVVNEEIECLDKDFGADGRDRLICECGNPDCTQPIELTRGEYEHVREYANHFVVALNHENPETESIIEQNERFAVVETYAGAPSQIARETDPRSQHHLRRTQPAAAEGGDLSDRSASSADRLALDRSHERKPLERDRRRTLYRQLNTQQAALCREFALDPERELSIKVVCECGLADCMTPIEMPLSEFEAVRAVPGWWVVSSAHGDELAGSIADRRDGYALLQDAPPRGR